MDRSEIIIAAGIGAAVIWLMTCVIIGEKRRKYVIAAGVLIDLILFAICEKYDLLLAGVLGGIFVGLFPASLRKYATAISEMKGVKNYVIVCIICCTMIFMAVGIACPDIRISLTGSD